MTIKTLLIIIAISLVNLNYQLFFSDLEIIENANATDNCGKRYKPCYVRIIK